MADSDPFEQKFFASFFQKSCFFPLLQPIGRAVRRDPCWTQRGQPGCAQPGTKKTSENKKQKVAKENECAIKSIC